MPAIADFVEPNKIVQLATPANLRIGHEIVDQHGVELTEFGPLRVCAKVGHTASADQLRTVTLLSTAEGLQWSCTCTTRQNFFCKHCVAAALVTWEKAPARRKRSRVE